MFELEVIKETEDWHVGDRIEAERSRADELVADGVARYVKSPVTFPVATEEVATFVNDNVSFDKPVVKVSARKRGGK